MFFRQIRENLAMRTYSSIGYTGTDTSMYEQFEWNAMSYSVNLKQMTFMGWCVIKPNITHIILSEKNCSIIKCLLLFINISLKF